MSRGAGPDAVGEKICRMRERRLAIGSLALLSAAIAALVAFGGSFSFIYPLTQVNGGSTLRLAVRFRKERPLIRRGQRAGRGSRFDASPWLRKMIQPERIS